MWYIKSKIKFSNFHQCVPYMKVLASFLELGQYLYLKTKSDNAQSLLCGFLLCFQWNRQRKSVAHGHPRVYVFLLQRTQTRLHSPYFPTPKYIHYMIDDIR